MATETEQSDKLSIGRIVLRVILVAVLLGVLFLGYLGWKNRTPEAQWEKAQTAMEDGNREQADTHLRNVLKDQPENGDAHFARAKLLMDQARDKNKAANFATNFDKEGQAMQHLVKAGELKPDDVNVQKTLLAARLQRNEVKAAGKVAEAVLKLDPKNDTARFARAEAHIADKEFARAEADVKALSPSNGKPGIAILYLQWRLAKGKEDKAAIEKAHARIVEITKAPSKLITPRNLGRLGLMQQDAIAAAKDVKTAHERMDLALKLQEGRASTGKQPVAASLQANRLARALIKAFPKVEDLDRTTRDKLLARVLDLGDAALKAGKRQPPFHGDLVVIANATSDQERAAKVTERTIKAIKGNPNVSADQLLQMRKNLAHHQIGLRQFKSAEEHIKALQADSQFAADGDYLAGFVALREGRLKDARALLEKARRQAASNPQVRLALAATLAGLNEWEDALPHFQYFLAKLKSLSKEERERFRTMFGGEDVVRLDLVRTQLQLKNLKAAEPHIKALRGAKQEPNALAMQALYLWNAGKKSEARMAIQLARTTFPKNLALASVDARFRFLDGKRSEADRIVKETVAKQPDDLAARIFELNWEASKGNYDDALALADAIEKKFPKQRERMMAFRAQMLLKKGDNEGAAKLAAELRKLPDWKATGERIGALAAMRGKNLDEAAGLLAAAANSQQRSGSLGLMRGQLAIQQGDSEAAAKAFAESLKYKRQESQAGRATLAALLKLSNEKDPADAESLVDKFLADNPRQPTLLLAKAELQIKQGRFGDAATTIKLFERERPQSGALSAYRVYWRIGRVNEALQALRRAVLANPRNPTFRLIAAQAALRMQQYAGTLSQAEAGLKLAPKSAMLALTRAAGLIGLKQYDDATQQLTKLTKRFPKDARAWLTLARLQFSQKADAKGFATLAAARKQNPKDASIVRESMTRYLAAKKPAEANKVARTFAGKIPGYRESNILTQAFLSGRDFASARRWGAKAKSAAKSEREKLIIDLLLADIELSQSRGENGDDPKYLKAARDAYAAIHKRKPEHHVAANNLSWLLAMKFNDPAGAIKVLQPMLDKYSISQLPANVVDTVVSVYLKANATDKAAKLLDDAVRLRATEPQWLKRRVDLAMQTANMAPVVARLNTLKTQRPRSADPPFQLARLLAAQQRHADAANELELALSLNPGNSIARQMAMELNVQLKNYNAVIAHADALIKANPGNWVAHRRKAGALQALKKDDEAKQTLQAAIKQISDVIAKQKKPQPGLIVELARLHKSAGDTKSELDVLKKGLEQSPRDLTLVTAAMTAHINQKQVDEARKLADAQFGNDPTFVECLQVARLFKAGGQTDAGIDWGERALKLAQRDNDKIAANWVLGDLLLNKANASGEKPQYETARDYYRNVLAIQPTHFVVANNVAWILAEKLGAAKEGLMVLEKYRGKTPPERLHLAVVDTYATVYRKTGQPEQARVLLEKVLSSNPRSGTLHYGLGLAYVDLKRPTPATRHLRQAIALGLDDEKGRKAREVLRQLEAEAKAKAKKKNAKKKS